MIVEPAMMNIGFVLPDDGYLAGVVETAHRHGAVAIFDEVKTGVTIAPGGATERFGVVPDIVCLAKAIGGGLPCGAVGGRADIMATITDGKVAQLGTFNGNPLTTAASRATLLEVLTGQAYSHLDALTEELSGGLRDVMAEYKLPFHVVSMGARGCVTYREEPVRNYRDYAAMDKSLAYVSWLYQTNRGVLMAPGAEENWTLVSAALVRGRQALRRQLPRAGTGSHGMSTVAVRTLRNFVDGEYREASSDVVDAADQPRNRRGIRSGAGVERRRRRRRAPRRAASVRWLARHHAQGPEPRAAAHRRRLRAACRGVRRARMREHRQADLADPERGDPAADRPGAVLRGLRAGSSRG